MMKVMIVKELMTGDVSPVAMFSFKQAETIIPKFYVYVKYLLWQLLFYVDFSFQTRSTKCPINEDQIWGAKPKVVSEELKDLGNFLRPFYFHL